MTSFLDFPINTVPRIAKECNQAPSLHGFSLFNFLKILFGNGLPLPQWQIETGLEEMETSMSSFSNKTRIPKIPSQTQIQENQILTDDVLKLHRDHSRQTSNISSVTIIHQNLKSSISHKKYTIMRSFFLIRKRMNSVKKFQKEKE